VRYTTSVRRSQTRFALFDRSLPASLAHALWQHPEKLVAEGEALRRNGARTTVRLHADLPYVLKHYVEPSWRHALKHSVQQSRARATWNISRALAESGLATPMPVACVENRWGPLRLDSFLVYPYVEGSMLRSYFSGELHATATALDDYRQQLAQLWQQLARLRATLADAHLGNFIISTTGRLWVIDLDRAQIHRQESMAARCRRRAWDQLVLNIRTVHRRRTEAARLAVAA
jgi:hypothetical protein